MPHRYDIKHQKVTRVLNTNILLKNWPLRYNLDFFMILGLINLLYQLQSKLILGRFCNFYFVSRHLNLGLTKPLNFSMFKQIVLMIVLLKFPKSLAKII